MKIVALICVWVVIFTLAWQLASGELATGDSLDDFYTGYGPFLVPWIARRFEYNYSMQDHSIHKASLFYTEWHIDNSMGVAANSERISWLLYGLGIATDCRDGVSLLCLMPNI